MQTIILCGGQGTRLHEETEYKPKPMVTIGNKPILWHIMKTYSDYGFSKFVLALGYRGNMIRDAFLNYPYYNNDFTIRLGQSREIEVHDEGENGNSPGWEAVLVETGAATLTGARVKMCERYMKDDPFMLNYGDGVGNVDLHELLRFHKDHGRIGTLTGVRPPSRWGELETNDERQVLSFMEKSHVPRNERRVSGGFFVFNRELFDYLSDDAGCILEDHALAQLAREGQLMVYHHDGFWQCMDTYRDFLYLNELWNSGQAPWVTQVEHTKK